MPPRYAYWTIIAGGLPTAFRAAEREDLLPTFQRIKEKHPDAEMKWFARGKLWDSPFAAQAAQQRGGRDRNWRPGGEHRDPRQKFIDAKKDRNARIRKERWEHKNTDRPPRPAGPAGSNRPSGPAASNRPSGPAASNRPSGPAASSRPSGPAGSNRPSGPAAHTRPAGPARKPWQNKPWDQNRGKGEGDKGKRWDAKKPWPRDEKRPGPRGERKPWERDSKKSWERDAKKPWERDAKKPWDREKPHPRAQGTEEPRPPKRPLGPNREPKPSENPAPSRPPHPDEPNTPPPGPPEQGRGHRPFRSQKRFNRGPRRG